MNNYKEWSIATKAKSYRTNPDVSLGKWVRSSDFTGTANDIVELFGGEENIPNIAYAKYTRLRENKPKNTLPRGVNVYYIKVMYKALVGYKVGITSQSMVQRMKHDRRRTGWSYEVLDTILFDNRAEALELESLILGIFRGSMHPAGRVLMLSGGTEVFEADVLGGTLPRV